MSFLNKDRPVLFLDIDGPMIPRRALLLNKDVINETFDPVAVSMVNDVLDRCNARMVLCSTWRARTKKEIDFIFIKNALPPSHFHYDWRTSIKLPQLSRLEQIMNWITRNGPRKFAILDDEYMKTDKLVQVTYDDGMMVSHYMRLLELLR